MIDLLSKTANAQYSKDNPFSSEARVDFYLKEYQKAKNLFDSVQIEYALGNTYLEAGNEAKAIELLERSLQRIPVSDIQNKKLITKQLALAYLRHGERLNCLTNHTVESCIFPIMGGGVHTDKSPSQKAIQLYETILIQDPTDFESRWLLNIAYMTTGQYPDQVPASFIIKGLGEDTTSLVKPFTDVAHHLGLHTNNLAGGAIVDDFNNDGWPDIITSSLSLKEGMHYARNNQDGTYTDLSDSSGISSYTGGLNIMQTDYNNDGWLDVFVVRGGWMRKFGEQPNSLLKNNGDGTFTDVTMEAGLLSFFPTQTATWADFNNDGWLDVFIGNETVNPDSAVNSCELFINNKNGTFSEKAKESGCDIKTYAKGVTAGDINNDGLTDIFISSLTGDKILLQNTGIQNASPVFKDISVQAGLSQNKSKTFPTWFWDFDNDGWQDILVCGYEYYQSLAWYAASEALKLPMDRSGQAILFRNKGNGSFEDVSQAIGLTNTVFAMSGNFGDINNDGFLDMYFGTGNPLYQSLIPNKMFLNQGGQRFVDVTTPSRLGNLQKGHGVAFADMDFDGDQDIYIEMGGIFDGDLYPNSLYINPGQSDNNWISLQLEGLKSNRIAIGARIKINFIENGAPRSVYRVVNTGGSFGANPLTQHIGVGKATSIDSIEINWPGTSESQVIRNLGVKKYYLVKQGQPPTENKMKKRIDLTLHKAGLISCIPPKRF